MYPFNALPFEATFGQDAREQRVVQRHADKQRSRAYRGGRIAAPVQSPELTRLSMQRDLARALNSTADLTGMLHQMMATLLQIPEIDGGSIYRVHPRSDGLDLLVQRGLSPQCIPCLAQDAATMAQHRRVLRGRPVYTHAMALMTDPESPYYAEGLRAVATIPVRTTPDTGGVVLMAASRTHETLSMRTRLMLETIAAQLGGWLARLEAETALQQAQADLERSSQQRTGALLQVNRQLEQSLLHLRTVVTNVPIILFTLDLAGMLTFAEGQGLDILGIPPDQLSGHAFIELWQHDRPARDAIRQALTGNDATFLETAGEHTFEIRLTPMTTAAGVIQGVIGLATDVTERIQAKACIERQNQRLTTLRQIDLSIIANRDLSQTLTVLVDHIQSRLGIDAAAVRLLNPQTQTLEYVAGQGFRSTVVQQADRCLGVAYAECTLDQCRPVYVPDVRQSHNERLLSAFVAEGFITYYRIPLILKDQIKGVLELFHRSRLTLDHGWRDFLDTLAGQASIAIDNKELVNRLQEANAQITTAYDATIASLVRALELRDAETEGHSRRVTEMTVRLAQTLGVRDADLEDMRRGAILHDIGKMAVPDHILLKPGQLSDAEWKIMRQHPVTAYRMLAPIPFLRAALAIPYFHHERWDGTGYPQRLQGEAIPLAARIFAVVDVWDALRSDRPYRKGWTDAQVCNYLQEQAGHHFDPQVVAAFLHIIGCRHERPRQMCIEA